jgi:hypothetical protein
MFCEDRQFVSPVSIPKRSVVHELSKCIYIRIHDHVLIFVHAVRVRLLYMHTRFQAGVFRQHRFTSHIIVFNVAD